MDDLSEKRLELKNQFSNFLEHGPGEYYEQIKAVISNENLAKNKLRLLIDVHDLFKHNESLYRDLIRDPAECHRPFEEAVDELARNSSKVLKEEQVIRIGFKGPFGSNTVSPRELSFHFLSRLINLEGIVTKCSTVRPKIVKSVHYAEAAKTFTTKIYRDATSLDGAPTGSTLPTKDDDGNVLTTEYGLCKYIDHQVLTVQELPEAAPPGQLPISAEIILEEDLTDSCKPGDRVRVVGVYKPLAPLATGGISGNFRAVLIANNVSLLSANSGNSHVTYNDIRDIERVAAQPNVLDLLAKSLAPSIYGHKVIKKGLILLLLGGRERNLQNGTHLRGDLNCLLVGDPGVAKSQLLRAVMNVAPIAVSTNGRGSSGVGLTAAVTHDKDTGVKRLEAGAMVLADRGIVCIDEFDKMNDLDRVAIHEVMEQQTVTIAKAGMHISLNARCSVVAAANPLFGQYDHSISITRNINLPDSLLSRFDLLFVVLDNLSGEQDKAIGEHVLGQHRYRGERDDHHDSDDEEMEEEDRDIHCKYNSILHGPLAPSEEPPLTVEFLRKFITIAKRRCSDVSLTGEAMEAIADFYCVLRGAEKDNALPVTVRTLETIIRLSTAAAKARLAQSADPEGSWGSSGSSPPPAARASLGVGVEARDVEVARELIQAMLGGHLDDSGEAQADASGGDSDDMEDDLEEAAAPPKSPQPGASRRQGSENDPNVANRSQRARAPQAVVLSEPQLQAIKAAVRDLLHGQEWTGTGDVAMLAEKLRETGGLVPADDVIVLALVKIQGENESGRGGSLPIMWEANEQKFYEASLH